MLLAMTIIQDLRFALRTLARNPAYTCVAVITLALGIGATTAIYSVVDGVLLHPIPFPEPNRLVALYSKSHTSEKNAVSYPNLLDWQRQSQTFEAIAGLRDDGFTLTANGQPEPVMGLMVSSNFFSVLRVRPLLGRPFTQEEDQRGAQPVALLGEEFWKRRFSGDPQVIGQNLTLDGRKYAVIGIVPAAVRMERIDDSFFNDVFIPIGQYDDPLFYERGTGNQTMGLGRLKPGVTLAQAQAEMNTISTNLAAAYPEDDTGIGANLVSFKQHMVGDMQPTLLALCVAVGFVLLIACTNIANLALARSASRTQEFAVRMALGAGRSRLIRLLLTESAVLSIGAGVGGLLIASWITDAALAMLPSALPAISNVEISGRVLLFTFVVSVVTAILFGLAPAVKASRVSLQPSLKQGGRGAIRGRYHLQRALIVAEVSLTLALLVGAGLMIRSLQKLWNVSPGLNPEGVLTFYTGVSGKHASSPDAIRAALREVNDRLAALPGVESASVEIGGLPFLGNTTVGFSSEDDPQTSEKHDLRIAHFYAVGPDHFAAMGIRLLRGRSFTRQDTANSALVVIVDEELARQVFPGQNPIGKHIRDSLSGRPSEIIGIAGHVKHSGLDLDASSTERAEFYFSYMQLPDKYLPLVAKAFAGIVRSKGAPATVMGSVRRELAAFDNSRAVTSEKLMTDAIAAKLANRRFSLMVLGAFAATALILSIVGIYGVVSYFVSERTNEIGVRMALGAQQRDIFLDVVSEGGKLGAAGVAIGLAGSAALTRLMTSLLFGTSPTDLFTFAFSGILLFALTLIACYIPARRAVRLDPMTALRGE
jgi:predicted permease